MSSISIGSLLQAVDDQSSYWERLEEVERQVAIAHERALKRSFQNPKNIALYLGEVES